MKVILDYFLKDPELNTVISENEILNVETQTEFIKNFYLPEYFEPGNYSIDIKLSYENKTATSRNTFVIKRKPYNYLEILFVIIIILSVFLILLLKIKKYNKKYIDINIRGYKIRVFLSQGLKILTIPSYDMLKVGDEAPDFSLKDANGNNIKLSNFIGKNVVLYFYPQDNTPGCTAEACSFKNNFSIYKKKRIVVLGVSKDNEISHKNFIDKYGLPFTLLCDTDGSVCKKYNAYGLMKLYGKEYEEILRKTFLIDKNGKIKDIIDKVNCGTHGKDVLEMF